MKQPRHHLLIVRTRPRPGRESEYHAWYEAHLDEVLAVPGFAAARRYAPRAVPPALDADGRFVAVFTLATDDAEQTMAEFDRARADMASPASLELESVSFELWEALGPGPRLAAGDRAPGVSGLPAGKAP